MRTKDQLRDIIASRLDGRIFHAYKFSDLVSAISSATPAQKQLLVDLLVKGHTKEAGDLLEKALKSKSKTDSITQADNLLADDSLSLTELDNII